MQSSPCPACRAIYSRRRRPAWRATATPSTGRSLTGTAPRSGCAGRCATWRPCARPVMLSRAAARDRPCRGRPAAIPPPRQDPHRRDRPQPGRPSAGNGSLRQGHRGQPRRIHHPGGGEQPHPRGLFRHLLTQACRGFNKYPPCAPPRLPGRRFFVSGGPGLKQGRGPGNGTTPSAPGMYKKRAFFCINSLFCGIYSDFTIQNGKLRPKATYLLFSAGHLSLTKHKILWKMNVKTEYIDFYMGLC